MFDNKPRTERQLFDTVCSECHQNCQVPFKPIEGKPVFCRECFNKRRR